MQTETQNALATKATGRGSVVGIFITAEPGTPLHSIPEAKAVAGKGIEGDRYFDKRGTFSANEGEGRELTMIEEEAYEFARGTHNIDLELCASRRNVVTRGIALNDLVGHDFNIGAVRVRGIRLCHPCGHLEKLTKPGVKDALEMRGGLRCNILEGGIIREGDAINAD